MTFKHPFYIKHADVKGTAEALAWLTEFYTRYPTGAEVAEALHQYRKENNLIIETEVKRKQIKQLEEDLDDNQNNGTLDAIQPSATGTQGHKKRPRRTSVVANVGTGDKSTNT